MQLFRQSSLLFLIWCISCSPPKTIYDNSGSFTFKKNINELISSSGLDANLGIKIVSLATGKTLYSLNSQKLLMPASNNKLYTCAAALEKLGSDYRFKTFVLRDGNNLILRGGGDPDLTIGQLDSLAKITAKKINLIDTLFVDESLLDSLHYGQGWMWDEGAWWYAAPISAMSLNDNCIDFYVGPGELGQPAGVEMVPETEYVHLINQSTTTNDTIDFNKFKIDRDWAGRTNIFIISGEVLNTASTESSTNLKVSFKKTSFLKSKVVSVKKLGNLFLQLINSISKESSSILKNSCSNLLIPNSHLSKEILL